MGKLFASARYFALVGVFFGLITSLAAFCWSGLGTIALVEALFHGEREGMAVGLVKVLDGLLIGAGLLIFSLGMYELFIGGTTLPDWLIIKDLDGLKSRVVGVVVMVMAVSFLERLETQTEPRDILFRGLAIASVSVALVVLMGRRGRQH